MLLLGLNCLQDMVTSEPKLLLLDMSGPMVLSYLVYVLMSIAYVNKVTQASYVLKFEGYDGCPCP